MATSHFLVVKSRSAVKVISRQLGGSHAFFERGGEADPVAGDGGGQVAVALVVVVVIVVVIVAVML